MSDEIDLSKVEDGFHTPGVICKSCGTPLAVVNDPSTIPDEFRIRCPKCIHDGSYRKAEITAIEVRKKSTEDAPSKLN